MEYAVVFLAVNAEYGGVPTVYIAVRGVEIDVVAYLSLGAYALGARGLSCCGYAKLLGGSAEVPVGEPHLFGLVVLLVKVEDAVVGDEGFETLLVVASQPVYAISSKRGSYAAETLAIYVWLATDIVDG